MATYRITPDLKARLKAADAVLAFNGITGGSYRYKRGECSCCYGRENGRAEFYEYNENIPGNWGIAMQPRKRWGGEDEEAEGYHKISFSIGDTEEEKAENLKKAQRVADIFTGVLEGSGWHLNWAGDLYSAMLIEKEPRKMETLEERRASAGE